MVDKLADVIDLSAGEETAKDPERFSLRFGT